MGSKIDEIRETLENARAIAAYIEQASDDEGLGVTQDAKQIRDIITDSLSALSAIDHEAIRRECAEKICALDAKLPAMRRSSYQEGYGDALDDAEAAIISAEPAQDDGEPEDESLQETLDRMDGYGIDNECGARG